MSKNIYLENFKKDAEKLLAEAGYEDHGGWTADQASTDMMSGIDSGGNTLGKQYADLAAKLNDLLMQFDYVVQVGKLPENSQIARMRNNLEKMSNALNGYGADAWEANS